MSFSTISSEITLSSGVVVGNSVGDDGCSEVAGVVVDGFGAGF